jgi:hypothetical protein
MRKALAAKTTRVPQRAKLARPLPLPPAPKIREDLSVEFFSLVRLALAKFGVTGAEQERAIERSRHQTRAPYVSGPLLRDTRGLCALLLEWSRDAEYLDPDGKPRVLAIRGAGATFERLARRFLPKKPLNDVVAMACATAEVTTRRGGKIALLGSIMVNVAKSPDNLLAHAIRQIDQLLETILHNAIVNRKGHSNGHMERMVLGVISAKEFDGFMSELRPQIYDLLQRVDSSVQQRQPKSTQSLRGATAVSVGVYVAREDDWDRAGIDARPLVARTPRRTKST